MTSSPVFDSQDAYAVQTLARHQAIRRLLSEVSMDIQVCRLEGWNPYEFIVMLETELANIRHERDKGEKHGRNEQAVPLLRERR